ncbi:MAG TPA: LPS assembly lipoprotein LptE [Gammaproteobacteria bacterium]|nr:LPS assembly lipoprotein LptE [Gammaproteobacteria bacterium]
MIKKTFLVLLLTWLISSCGFHPRSPATLAKPLQSLYFQSKDPYSALSRLLKQNLKMSGVSLASNAQEATTTLSILQESMGQDLLSINSSQQTRQYNLHLTIVFQVSDSHGEVLVTPQTLTETRTLTLQSNQVLAGSNQAAMLYNDMRRSIAYNIMNRLASKDISKAINHVQGR